ncbi:SulP family inorganic anion transporter [Stenomitos frigidus]|uniref:Sodium-independent anion transporter n=1 Tax=Stenomitos frigidus ULC18 TaxID=2107698 RepID=A0A2T1EB92_9CYAN|nr:SulP family inorganic anion transporter [Stenomitos frigidus]PSB30032.1 sodium-independent anion transporter [Stenomitos frigidus ULC18]
MKSHILPLTNPQSIRARFLPPQPLMRLLPSLSTGLTTGAIGVIFDLSYAALIFSGSLASHLAAGISLVLFSAATTRIAIVLTSSFPGMVADLGTVPTAILAWSVGMVVKQMPTTASSAEILVTALATIALTSLLTGTVLLLLGVLRLGGWVRSLPTPVLGGFIASTGWLLVKGACKIMTDKPLELAQLPALMQPERLMHWLPGLFFALYLLVITKRRTHPLVMITSLLGAIGLFYLLLPLTGTPAAAASQHGWTLAIPTQAGFVGIWRSLHWSDFWHIHWDAIATQWLCLATVTVTTAISLLMNVSSMELMSNKAINPNQELKVAGLANLAISLWGGILSYHSLSKSVLAHKLGSRGRLITLIDSAVFILVPLLGSSLLAYFPKPVLSGLLLFLGLSLLLEWVYAAWCKLSRWDYFIVQLIWIISGTVGFLQGLTVGWVVAIGLLAMQSKHCKSQTFDL